MNFVKRLHPLISLLLLLLLAVWPLNSPGPTGWLGPYWPQSASTISEKKAEMVSNNLLKLARAMAEFEGWHYQDKAGVGLNHASISWRNHNPGNLRKSPWAIGINDGFAVFINDEIGFSALIWDLHQKAIGNTTTGLNSQSTIYQLIKKYSGESDEIVLNYATFIERKTGFKMSMKLEEIIKGD